MKRKREMENKSEIKSATEEISLLIQLKKYNNIKPTSSDVAGADGVVSVAHHTTNDDLLHHEVVLSNLPTLPFLSLCSSILQVLDKIGPTMAVLRRDIKNNIKRLEKLYESDQATYSNLVEILKNEAAEGNAKKGDTCSKALVWLTRALDFTAALLQKLTKDQKQSMDQIVASAYEMTLKPWHGWISATAYRVALKLVPETDIFICLLLGKDENLDTFMNEIQAFVSLLVPLLEDLHSTLGFYGLQKLKAI